jgi:hypothetical protein
MNCIHRASSHAVGRRTDVRGEFHPRRVRETRLGKLHAGMIATSSSPEVRSPRSLRALVVTSLLLASLLCACSQVQARGGRSTLTPSRAVLAMLSSKSSLSRPELARRDAARLLTLVRLPPESRRLAQAPRSDAKILSSPAQSLGDPDLVDLLLRCPKERIGAVRLREESPADWLHEPRRLQRFRHVHDIWEHR